MVLDVGRVERKDGPAPYVRIEPKPLETLHDRVFAELLRPRRRPGVTRTTPLRIAMRNGTVWLLPAGDVDSSPPAPVFGGFIEAIGEQKVRALELSTYSTEWIPALVRTLLLFGDAALPPLAPEPIATDSLPGALVTPMGTFF